MAKMAVVKTGGKQYLVNENDEIIVEKLEGKDNDKVELETLAQFDTDKSDLELGAPMLKSKVQGQIVAQVKGDKVRVAKFKAKVRYRKVIGFRPKYTKIKITKI